MSTLIMMPTVVVHLSADSFSTEVKEPNPRCAARNGKQAKIINGAKTARLRRRVPYNSSTTGVKLSVRS